MILKDFDLSIVMPFYKRFSSFKKVFDKQFHYFERNGIELIICLDEPSETELILDYIKNYPFINWKIIVNEKDHEWRNPSKAINVGIRHASKKYILQIDPELELLTDVIYILRRYLEYYPNHYATGQVIFTDLETEITENNYNAKEFVKLPYGSIMARKSDLEMICGYNEEYINWGGDDDNIRIRLDLAGVRKLFYPQAILIHRENFSLRKTSRSQQRALIPPDLLADMLIPTAIIANKKDWGVDFNKVLFNWQEPSDIKRECCYKYISSLGNHYISSDPIFSQKYKLIVLIPAYNEASRIQKCIDSLPAYCDGVILLDDGSTDNTYNLATGNKILLKVRKSRDYFDDLKNRNILLNIASFICSEWFIFLDTDESISSNFNDLEAVMSDKNNDIIGVWIANLWDDENKIRTDMPDGSLEMNGLWLRWRLFRNKGRMQIISNKHLHFTTVPYMKNYRISKTLLLHTGYLEKNSRNNKYNFYIKEDENNEAYYSNILENKIIIQGIESIDMNYTKESIEPILELKKIIDESLNIKLITE